MSINVHERVDIFATNLPRYRKNVKNRQEPLDVFSCGDNSDRIIAVVDLIFLQVVFYYDMSGVESVHTTLKLFNINIAIASWDITILSRLQSYSCFAMRIAICCGVDRLQAASFKGEETCASKA